ncbi:MAG: hypothetical protein ACLGHN_11020 [Bacteriovoracia bacterium]
MRFLPVILILFFTSVSKAQINSERAVSAVVSTTDTEEAKLALLHQAVLETIEQHANEMGIDPLIFKSRLQEKFTAHFEEWKLRKLSEKFGKKYAVELTEEQKKTFLDGLEVNRHPEFVSFARLSRLVDSYAFRKIENDSETKDLWKGEVLLNLNRGRAEKFHKRLLSDENKHYSRLIVLPELNLLGLNWNDLALEKSSSFSDPLLNSWSKWLINNQPSNVEEVIKCTGTCIEQFNQWLQISQEEGMQIPEELRNSLWIKILFNIRKINFIPEINEWQFEWDGSVVLLDTNTKLLLSSRTIGPHQKTWRRMEQKELNSALASAMYKSALEPLSKISRKIEDSSRFNRLSRLVIRGHRHMGDVISLIESLKKEGSKLYLELKLDSFNQNEAHLLCFYQGEEKSFTDLLSGVKELKSSHSYQLVNEFTGIHHILKLVAQ